MTLSIRLRSPPILSSSLQALALNIRQAMPCSVTLPAGTGKTELIAAIAACRQQQERALILTHTNAGVEALRARLHRFGVSPDAARVDTIASWSHQLVRHYPRIAEITVSAEPDWAESKLYYEAAHRVVSSPVLRRVLRASYAFAVVDEYQDCGIRQHGLITAVAQELPVAVLGDPLQAIFGFDTADPAVDWSTDVLGGFPPATVDLYPWRWKAHNEQLGQWLLDAHRAFDQQQPLIIGEQSPVRFIPSGVGGDLYGARVRACRDLRNEFPRDTIVVIGKWARDCHSVAARLTGTYTAIEPIEGQDMLMFARMVDRGTDVQIAVATAEFAKQCCSGIAEHVKKDDIRRLAAGRSITGLKRPGAEQVQQLLTNLLTDPAAPGVRAALTAMGQLPGVRRYRHDAWSTVIRALTLSMASSTSVETAVASLRNRTRAAGRPASAHVVASTLLVKGLEFDHAIVLDAAAHEPTSLYVALTRARKTLTVIGPSRSLATTMATPIRQRPALAQPPTLWDGIPEFV